MNNCLGVVFLTVTVVIGHTQERLTADHKWMQGEGSTSRNGLEQNELAGIPLVNEGVRVECTSSVLVGNGKECMHSDVERLHILCSTSLKRLRFDEVFP